MLEDLGLVGMPFFAVFRADYDEKSAQKFGTFADQTVTLLRKAGYAGQFREFDVQKQQYPTDAELADICAVWVTGSVSDAFANDDWIVRLNEFLADKLLGKVPVVGICFGHQIVGRALGAQVDRNPQGWELGIETVDLNKGSPDVVNLFPGKSFNIIEVHQDIVFDLPQGVTNIGSTDRTSIQGFYKKDKLLTFQGHPEFEKDFVLDVLSKKLDQGMITQQLYDASVARLESDQHDGVEIAKTILKFLSL